MAVDPIQPYRLEVGMGTLDLNGYAIVNSLVNDKLIRLRPKA